MDDKTTLNDLLALNLHEFEDEVRNIVDKATKELNMEKVRFFAELMCPFYKFWLMLTCTIFDLQM